MTRVPVIYDWSSRGFLSGSELTAIVDLKLVAYGNTKQNKMALTRASTETESVSDVLELCTSTS